MQLKVEENCPLNGFKKCKQFKCAWFVQMKGTSPNDGTEVDEYACAIAWLPLLLVENAMQSRQAGAAIESFRNEMVKANESNQNLLELSKFLEMKNKQKKNLPSITDDYERNTQ